MVKIAVFSSGSGSNAGKIFEYFKNHPSISVEFLVCNRKEAGVFQRAEAAGIPSFYFSKSQFSQEPEVLLDKLNELEIDVILLAGFLLLIPDLLIDVFEERILNIHPALLPDFGGSGMYGNHVHEAVKNSGASQTGLTIHVVNKEYDSGKVIFQARCPVFTSDSVSDIAARVLQMEHAHYSFVAEQFIQSKIKIIS